MKFNMQEMLQQAQKMQQEMDRVKEEAGRKQVTEESGGGMVKITMNGNNEVLEIKIAKEIVNPEDIEMLEDLIVAAMNKAGKAAQEVMQQEINRLSGMLPKIPGFNI